MEIGRRPVGFHADRRCLRVALTARPIGNSEAGMAVIRRAALARLALALTLAYGLALQGMAGAVARGHHLGSAHGAALFATLCEPGSTAHHEAPAGPPHGAFCIEHCVVAMPAAAPGPEGALLPTPWPGPPLSTPEPPRFVLAAHPPSAPPPPRGPPAPLN